MMTQTPKKKIRDKRKVNQGHGPELHTVVNEADLKNIEGLNEGDEVQEGVVWLSDSDKATHKLLQIKTVCLIYKMKSVKN